MCVIGVCVFFIAEAKGGTFLCGGATAVTIAINLGTWILLRRSIGRSVRVALIVLSPTPRRQKRPEEGIEIVDIFCDEQCANDNFFRVAIGNLKWTGGLAYGSRYHMQVDSGDHRIIMAAAVWGKATGKELKFKHPEAVAKSWPEFWNQLT